MEAILRVALSNTLLAAMLALAALAISRTFRRPALSHAMWLIVLLKLVTPPLWNVAVPLMPAEKTHKPPLPPTELSMPPAEPEPNIDVAEAKRMDGWEMSTLSLLDITDGWHGQRYSDARAFPQSTGHGHASTPVHATHNFPQFTMSQSLLIVWIAGSTICVLIIAVRVRRFTRLLRFAQPADAHTQMLARALSFRVGIEKSPRVWFVPGPLCPMLWAFGSKAKLLIPAGLWERLDYGQRSTLLLHDLAHYRRGDHWIRGLELLITILFWWNPIAWWARHELREAEEQCCDAWVVWTLPRAARDYAVALMEAIDFVSTTRLAVPVLASPMGEFHDLKRRLLMIKQSSAPRALGWTGYLSICVLAAILLPLSATLAQPEKPQPAGLPPVEPAAELPPATTPPATGDIAVGLAGVADNDPNTAAQREARALEDELQKTSAEIAKLTARLHAAQERLAEIQRATLRANPQQLGQPFGEG
ncbi:MAG TPA: M56 family metallopeptidase, partial [Tepidisphaeraceae bacterium]|nr:M56 family metallopeptidase [Tepidisphaeraceae bacterium]